MKNLTMAEHRVQSLTCAAKRADVRVFRGSSPAGVRFRYRVADPDLLERLLDSDPLRQLEEAIAARLPLRAGDLEEMREIASRLGLELLDVEPTNDRLRGAGWEIDLDEVTRGGPSRRIEELDFRSLGVGGKIVVDTERSLDIETTEAAPASQPAIEEVQFSAYAPRSVRRGSWHTLLAYCHLPSALAAIEEDSKALGRSRKETLLKSSAPSISLIARGAEITFVPELKGCRFNPPRASVLWLEDWQRIEFRFRPDDDAPGPFFQGTVRCFIGPVLIAEIPISTKLVASDRVAEPTERETATPYQSVFVSYSHKDLLLVEQLEQAYTVLGLEYLRDVKVLRSGQEWNPELLRKIEEADIFQLCWSSNARTSPYVEQEWRHALALNRQAFIRPMFWEDSKLEIPPELSQIHFARFRVSLTPQ